MMASALDRATPHEQAPEPAAVIDAAEFDEAQRDPRLQRLIAEADSYLAELEQARRNRWVMAPPD